LKFDKGYGGVGRRARPPLNSPMTLTAAIVTISIQMRMYCVI